MPKLTNIVPSYRLHKQSGQAIVTLSGRDFLLGLHGSKASKAKYNRLVAEWLANDRQPFETDGLTIAELAARYWRFAKRYYVKSHLPSKEQGCIRAALRPLLSMYENELAANFGPVALRAVRDEMLSKGDWSRQTINRNTDRIRRMFRWAASEELLPIETYQRLATLPGLRKGRCGAREAKPVRPISDAIVEATLPHLTRTVADMVEVQRLTGMRPAEVCIMRPCDLDRSGDVWTYRPESHKTEHHDQSRVVFIGPKAQAILLRYLARDAQAYCFRPVDSEAKRRAEQHASRKTPINCGNRPGKNRKRRATRPPGNRYETDSYRRAVERACDRRAMQAAAGLPFAPAKGESFHAWVKRQTGVSRDIVAEHLRKFRWTPGRLRHSAATEIRQRFGLEAAQVVLGHTRADVTQVYAERDMAKGVEVARMIG